MSIFRIQGKESRSLGRQIARLEIIQAALAVPFLLGELIGFFDLPDPVFVAGFAEGLPNENRYSGLCPWLVRRGNLMAESISFDGPTPLSRNSR
jgi:hypothetical protein